TLSAMPLACFPNIHFPDDAHDADTVRRFLVGLSFSQPLQRDMTDARTYEASGKTFVVTHGTIAYKEEGDALSRRISVSMVLTQHRGYLLMWIFAAPHDAELRELMNARMGFDSDPATTEAKASAVSSPEITMTPGGAVQSEAAADRAAIGPSPSAPNGTISTSQSGQGASPVTDPISSRPSLLKPGETMQDQSIPGQPLPKRPSQ
ncbi:MAG TPA: hypothetical protein VII29_10655, partial [Terriglobales bacterium]